MNNLSDYMKFYSDVKEAIINNMPVVALESTLISHAMPYPQNIDTAVALGDIIKRNGAVPATIAVIKGKIKVGVSLDEMEMLCKSKDVVKISRRDIPYVVAKGLNGATTVAATMFLASLAKIKVFATGGIGGVHVHGAQTLDVSADVTELSKSSLVVVCAGAKPVVDIGLTLEKLDTLEVPVVGYKTTNFPGFYIRKSGYRTAYSLSTPEEIAKAFKIKCDLGLNGGMIVANPVPQEYELDEKMISDAIDSAIKDAESKKINGKELTPYIFTILNNITGGQSLKSNMALVKNNSELAAKISGELVKLTPTNLSLDRETIF